MNMLASEESEYNSIYKFLIKLRLQNSFQEPQRETAIIDTALFFWKLYGNYMV